MSRKKSNGCAPDSHPTRAKAQPDAAPRMRRILNARTPGYRPARVPETPTVQATIEEFDDRHRPAPPVRHGAPLGPFGEQPAQASGRVRARNGCERGQSCPIRALPMEGPGRSLAATPLNWFPPILRPDGELRRVAPRCVRCQERDHLNQQREPYLV